MPHKMRIPEAWVKTRPNFAKWPFMYTVDASVGLGGANNLLDVMLVQFMLWSRAKAFYNSFKDPKDSTSLRAGMGGPFHPGDQLPLDGKFSNLLLLWMLMFQYDSWSDSKALTGKVAPIHGLPGPHDNMARLNADLMGMGTSTKSAGHRWFMDLSSAPQCPAALAHAIKAER